MNIRNSLKKLDGSHLILSCPKTRREFDSGFIIEPGELSHIPPATKWKLRCKICLKYHEFRILDGHVEENNREPD
jgi:hypothetical protein